MVGLGDRLGVVVWQREESKQFPGLWPETGQRVVPLAETRNIEQEDGVQFQKCSNTCGLSEQRHSVREFYLRGSREVWVRDKDLKALILQMVTEATSILEIVQGQYMWLVKRRKQRE